MLLFIPIHVKYIITISPRLEKALRGELFSTKEILQFEKFMSAAIYEAECGSSIEKASENTTLLNDLESHNYKYHFLKSSVELKEHLLLTL